MKKSKKSTKALTVWELSSMGGKARAAKLSKKRRAEIARMGVEARIRNLKKEGGK